MISQPLACQSNDAWIDNLRTRAFGSVKECVRHGSVNRDDALEIMRQATLEYYPECVVAFGHGSSITGHFSSYSDLDVIVLLHAGEFWEKRCVNFRGYLVEFQAYTLDVLDLMLMLSRQSGMALGLLPDTAQTLIDSDGSAAKLHEKLSDIKRQGPSQPSESSLRNTRTRLTNQTIELLTVDTPLEQQACGLAMYEPLTKLLMTLDGDWIHRGKWVPRSLCHAAPEAFPKLTAAYRSLMEGDPQPLARMATELLERIGGPLWTDYLLHAPIRIELLPAGAVAIAANLLRD